MARKQWTDEERKAFGDKMKAAKAAKTTKNNIPEETKEVINHDEIAELRQQIEELKRSWQPPTPQDERVRLTGGKIIGTVEKYDLTPSTYPSPIDRLTNENKLRRFAFAENYDLNFEVGVSEYTTIDNIRTREPKFTLELIGRIYDDETGDLTKGRYIISRLIMHEDPEAALVIAREQDLEVDEENEEAFLNEMRYIRMRDWLITCFVPAPRKNNNRKKEMVVGGKIVEYFEITADEEDNVKIPFDKIAGRKL